MPEGARLTNFCVFAEMSVLGEGAGVNSKIDGGCLGRQHRHLAAGGLDCTIDGEHILREWRRLGSARSVGRWECHRDKRETAMPDMDWYRRDE